MIPSLVILGWIRGNDLTLYFEGYETACLFLSSALVGGFLQGGTSNWLIGAYFLGMYGVVAWGFWIHEKEGEGQGGQGGHEGW